MPPSYQKGHTDRATPETWHSSLSGEFLAGADYWATHRSTPNPGTCKSDSPQFTAGCMAAKVFLDPIDAQRKADPVYRLGFNTYP